MFLLGLRFRCSEPTFLVLFANRLMMTCGFLRAARAQLDTRAIIGA